VKDNTNFLDQKQIVEQGYDQVADEYTRLEGENEWPRTRWLEKIWLLARKF